MAGQRATAGVQVFHVIYSRMATGNSDVTFSHRQFLFVTLPARLDTCYQLQPFDEKGTTGTGMFFALCFLFNIPAVRGGSGLLKENCDRWTPK